MDTIYISGSITDGGTLTPPEIAERIKGFHEAERKLRAWGYEVKNPARHGSEPGKTWLDYMRLALVDISEADGIALLPGWERSRGARLGKNLGDDLGLPSYMLGRWKR